MHRRPPPAVLGGSPDEIEAQFYEALQRGNLEQLMSLWADDDEIVCLAPGGVRAVGAAAIRACFQALFANGGIPIQPEQVRRLQQVGSALHHLVQRIAVKSDAGTQTAWLLATNFYVKTPQGWRLASHHASPGLPQPPGSALADGPSTLH